MEKANLFELTGHETGIVFNTDGDFAMIQNWSKNDPVYAGEIKSDRQKNNVIMLLRECREIDGDVNDCTDISNYTADDAIIYADMDGIHYYVTFYNWN